jgi:hypothetical protein
MARIPTVESLTVDSLAFSGKSEKPRSNIRLRYHAKLKNPKPRPTSSLFFFLYIYQNFSFIFFKTILI